MIQTINVKEKTETLLVEISCAMFATGTTGSLVVASLPSQYQPLGYSVCGALISASTLILTVWHKWINVYKATKETETKAT